MNGYMHCKVVDGLAVAIKVDTINPVVPIPEADFVTGSIVDPRQISQAITLFQYNGLQVNGDTSGTLVGVDDQVTTLKAFLILAPPSILEDSFTRQGYFPTINTVNNTETKLGDPWELPEGKKVYIKVLLDAQRSDSFDVYNRGLRYVIYRKVGENAVIDDNGTQFYKNGPNNITAELVLDAVNVNEIQAMVTGRNGQTWDWRIVEYTFDLEDLI